jgi:hypothetical protein
LQMHSQMPLFLWALATQSRRGDHTGAVTRCGENWLYHD